MNAPVVGKTHKAWQYLLAATSALLILIPVWTLLVMLAIQPQELMQEPTVGKQLMWWVVPPVLVVAGLVGWRWQVATNDASRSAKITAEHSSPKQTGPVTDQTRHEYVLEVIGLGVTFDKFRQGSLWNQLAQGNPYVSVREEDPMKYPWGADEKNGMDGTRANDALESGVKFGPIYWGQPALYAGASAVNEGEYPISPTNPMVVIGDTGTTDMAAHPFVAAGWELSERPDRILERVFAFFDEYPDVPYVVLSAEDSLYFRDLNRPKGTAKLVRDGNYIPEMPDSSALFMLARRERVDAVRPFVFTDADADLDMLAPEANKKAFGRRLYLAHLQLSKSVPRPEGDLSRTPTVAEWLQTTKAFSQRDDIYPKGFSALAGDLNPFRDGRHPPPNYKPSPWFPLPWSADQLEAFDHLPTLGFLHRPVFVKTVDDQGKPLSRRDARAAALAAGWQEALQTLPESERKAAPARVITATGASSPASTEQTIALTTVLKDWTEHGCPELDKSKAIQWINTDARLGNTGAATWFMQMAIGVMGSYRDGGASAAINLRDPSEASIVFITPPPDTKRTSQKHPLGFDDVFKFKATPAIDPKNYEPH